MNVAYHASVALSILVFLSYGLHTLLANGMVSDFERFGLAYLRRFTGAMEVLGALGLLAGVWVPVLVIPSAAGLAALMLGGIVIRIRTRDPVSTTVPAVVLLGLNLFVVAFAARFTFRA